MAKIKRIYFEKLFGMGSGYVLEFTNREFQQFILDTLDLDIYSSKYDFKSGSKANRLRRFIEVEDDHTVYKLLKALLDHWKANTDPNEFKRNEALFNQCLAELDQLSGSKSETSIKFAKLKTQEDKTVIELKRSIEQEIKDSRFSAALDRLHTFTVKYFRAKCLTLGIKDIKDKPLQSLVGEYVKAIEANHSEMTVTILKVSISVFDKYNKIRNDKSLAHDNTLLDNQEARLIIDWVLSTLFFIDNL